MTRIITLGCKAGVISGIVLGLLLVAFVSPIILEAEKYEVPQSASTTVAVGHEHHHDSTNDFEPVGWQRPALTVFGTGLLGIAYGILAAVFLIVALKFDLFSSDFFESRWKAPLIFGIAGFLIFQGIPALGLHPALPGIVGAEDDFSVRQHWWMFSVACSLGAIVIYPFLKTIIKGEKLRFLSVLLAVALLAVPFIVGVPAHSETSTTPELLRHQFAWVSLSVNGVFWLVLATTLIWFIKRETKGASKAPGGLLQGA